MSEINYANISNTNLKSIGDPNEQYNSLSPVWRRIRAVVAGEAAMKAFDRDLRTDGSNLLIPFSSSMTREQYSFYRCEAEAPGFVAQYVKTVLGAMLRKEPQIELPDTVPSEALDWIRNRFSADNQSLLSFLDDALLEDLVTSRAWVCVNYPGSGVGTDIEPYPILLSADSIVNWRVGAHPVTGDTVLTDLVIRLYVQDETDSRIHPRWIDRVFHHYLDESGGYTIDVYDRAADNVNSPVVDGRVVQNYAARSSDSWNLVGTEVDIMRAGERLDFIPIFPLNGSVEPDNPYLTNLIDREVGLYNKISRRNHLLYGTASFTPTVIGTINDDDQQAIVESGLGSWLFLPENSTVEILQAPSESLQDLDRAIEIGTEDLARMGIRLLAPETNTQESGVSLEIRNSSQSAQIATISRRISNTVRSIITLMINWRYGLDIREEEITFVLSTDLSPVPIGDEYVRIIYEMYQSGVIPRSVFVETLKNNDVLPSDYDDENAMNEISSDGLVMGSAERFTITQANSNNINNNTN